MSTGIIFPPEIIEEILYRLPVKSLGRFKCVPKPWQTLISTPKFIKSHLNHSRRHLEKLLVASGDGKFYSIDLANQSSLKNEVVYPAEATELQFLPQQILWDEVTGFCNGLVMATDTEETSFLINPTTGEYAEVGFPEDLPEEPDFTCERYFMNGLGYDTKNDDYKVVVISYYDVPNEEGIRFRERLNTVYSFRSNTLREVTAPPRHHAVCESTQGVYLDGRIHWICTKVSDSSEFIAAFSLESEEFEEVEIPSSVSYANVGIETLVAVNGSLCFSVREDDNVIEVRMMKEYGVTESWKKISIYGLGSSTVMPLSLMGKQEVVLHVDWCKYVVYNIEEKTLRAIEICGISSRFELWGTYVESLVSPNYAVGLREDYSGSNVSTI